MVSTGGLLGSNMFAYCINNPVNKVDRSGRWPEWVEDAWDWLKEKYEEISDGLEEDAETSKDNSDIEKVKNANYFSFYEGTLIIITPFDASFSFGFIGLSDSQRNETTILHEKGHADQLDEMGWIDFVIDVAIPSVTANILDRQGKLQYDYYGSPWEADADKRRGVNRTSNNSPWPDDAYDSCWDMFMQIFKE